MEDRLRNTNDFVSIIVPCYNYGHFISYTLDSVLQQTHSNWECIVVDDGSTDNTKDVVYSYINRNKRFKYVYQTNKGPSAARNTGIKEAKGDFVQFLDADDLIEKRKLELQVAYLSEHPEVDIVYGEARYFPTEKPEQRLYSMKGDNVPWMPKVSGKGEAVLECLVHTNIMPVSSPLMKRRIIDACGLFDETLRSHEDWDYWLRCAFHNAHFSYFDHTETYTLIRNHPDSATKNQELMLTTQMVIRERVRSKLKNSQLYFSNRRYFANTGITLAVENIRRGENILGLSRLIKYLFLYALYMAERIIKARRF